MRWLLFWRPPCLLRRVIVNLQSDETRAMRGVLWSARGPWLTLKEAEALMVGAAPVPIEGDVVVHRSNVAFLQVLP